MDKYLYFVMGRPVRGEYVGGGTTALDPRIRELPELMDMLESALDPDVAARTFADKDAAYTFAYQCNLESVWCRVFKWSQGACEHDTQATDQFLDFDW